MICDFISGIVRAGQFVRRKAFLLFGCLLMASGCGTLTRKEVTFSDAEVRRLARDLDVQAEVLALAKPLIDAGHAPGIVVGVLMPDQRRHVIGYGRLSSSAANQPDGHSLFPIGSISKSFVALVTAQLVASDLAFWNKPLEDYFINEAQFSHDAKRITLTQLASHTAGLPRQPNTPLFIYGLARYLVTGDNFYTHIDQKHLMRYLTSFRSPRDVKPKYSNIGYAYLAMAIEKTTRVAMETLVDQLVLQPLCLVSTGYEPGATLNRAQGHAGDQPKLMKRGRCIGDWVFATPLRSSVGLYSCAEDLLTFSEAHIYGTGYELMDAALADVMVDRTISESYRYAMAWTHEDIAGHRLSFQTGVSGGFTCYLGINQSNRIAVVVLQNAMNLTERVGHQLLFRLTSAIALKHDAGEE